MLDQGLTLVALDMALTDHVLHIHHSDQGVQYAAHAYIDLLTGYQIQISMAAVGEAEENGYAERLMRTIKEEEVDLSENRDFADAYIQIGRFIEDVNNYRRIHSSLGYLTPAEFETAWRVPPKHTRFSVQLFGSIILVPLQETLSKLYESNWEAEIILDKDIGELIQPLESAFRELFASIEAYFSTEHYRIKRHIPADRREDWLDAHYHRIYGRDDDDSKAVDAATQSLVDKLKTYL